MFAIDTLVTDLVFGVDAKPRTEALLEAVGGEEAARALLVLDPDLDFPQYELEVSPTVPLRQRGERRLLIVEEAAGPLRRSPQTEPIVARDLRPALARLVALVEKTGARFGRLGAFGTWGDAALVVRAPRDLRGLFLVAWALDPSIDLQGRRRASPLSQREFEEKLAIFDKRLDELDDAAILARVPPARLERLGDLLIVDVLSDRDGSWDTRKSLELTLRVAAIEHFAHIPGAPVKAPPPAGAAAAPPGVANRRAPGRATIAPEPPAPPEPPPAPEPPPPAGPPLDAVEVEGRVILKVPADRLDLDAVTALGRKGLDVLRPGDRVTGRQRDRIAHEGAGFVAPLSFLSEVFLDGKPLDRRRFDAEARPLGDAGARALEGLLPRFGPVLVVDDGGGRRWITSERALPADRLLAILKDGA